MHRVVARLLLIVLLAGSYAPLALAFSASPPHACCMRKHAGDSRELSFDSQRYGQDCCRLLATNQWAQPRPSIIPTGIEHLQVLTLTSSLHPRMLDPQNSHAVRAPPSSPVL